MGIRGVIFLSFGLLVNASPVAGFVVGGASSTTSSPSTTTTILKAGMGMGGATATKSKKNKKKKSSVKIKKSPSGSAAGAFDVNASLLRMEKKYDVLMAASAKRMMQEDEDPRWATTPLNDSDDIMTSEFVVAVRSAPSPGVSSGTSDWVPVAQLCLARPSESGHDSDDDFIQHPSLRAAVSAYCRELYQSATLGAPVFKTLPRTSIQYSIERVDSFYKYVYEPLLESSSTNSEKGSSTTENSMTKAQAREHLGIGPDESPDKAELKQLYRRLCFENHPDRVDDTDKEKAVARFANIQEAFETLSSGVRGVEGTSWYQSLGGRSRSTEFLGPLALMSIKEATNYLETNKMEGALVGLDPDVVQSFVARNLRSA